MSTSKKKLLDQVRDALRLKQYAYRTEKAYVAWIRRFILFHQKRHPRDMGVDEVTAFLTHLAVDRHVAPSTQNQALSALLFLYRTVLQRPLQLGDGIVSARKPRRLPTVLSPNEVHMVLGQIRGVPGLVARLLYGSGMRISEALQLRVKDLAFDRQEIVVRDGKGRKDRGTILPESL